MSSGLPASNLVGKRKRKKDPNPNPLFSQWLAEWRDEAKGKGWKSEYIYSKALNSLKKYPLPLSTGKECKILQHFGDKICKMLDDRLLKHREEQETKASLRDSDTGFPSASSWTSHPQLPATVHEISDSSDEDVDNSQTHKSTGHVFSDIVQASNGASMMVKTVPEEGFDKASSTKWTGLASRGAVETVDVDEDIFLEQSSPNKCDSISSDDDDDDDLPELPRLTCLDNGHEDVMKLKTKLSSNREFSVSNTGDSGPAAATSVVRVTDSVTDCDGGKSGRVLPPRRRAGRGGGRQTREYVPAYRSGPYAVLLILFRQAQDPSFRGFMTKAELCHAAQPLAEKSFTVADPGSRYTAWSSVSALVRKGYLVKESSPAKYRLTDAGYELAHRLEEVERPNAAGQHRNGGGRPDGLDDDVGGGEAVLARRGGLCASAATDCDTDTAQRYGRQVGTLQKRPLQTEDPDTLVTGSTGTCGHAAVSTAADCTQVESASAEAGRLEKEQRIVVEDCDADEDSSSDELPPLSLPSLAHRLKAPAFSSLSGSREVPGDRRLQFWYVAEGDELVSRKNQACVEIDEAGVSFLVKINYQHLLQSGCQYRLDMARPLGDDFVFAYLSDKECCEEAQPPLLLQKSPDTNATIAAASAAAVRSSSAGTKNRHVHEISDSDSESDQVSSKPDIISSISSHDSLPSHTSAKSSDLCSRLATHGDHSSRSVVKVVSESANAGVSKLPVAPLSSSSQNSVGIEKSAACSIVKDFVLHPGTFEVVLCVDNREYYGSQSSSKSLLPDLIRNGVTCDLRLLHVGDILWVAREKAPAAQARPVNGSAGQSGRQELVLSYVVERKRMDDLVSSMIGGRLKEQKFRLKHSGLQEKIILIESYGSMQHFSISEDRIKQAIANSEIIDGFTVKCTGDSKETAAYLTLMTRYLQSFYQNKTLRSCSRDAIKDLGVKFCGSDTDHMLMPFDHFNQASLKNKPLSVTELFAKQLIQLWGMSAEKARAVVDRYPSPARLFEAYMACSSEKERDSLLATLKYGKNLRNLGIALSRQVAQLYTVKRLT